ncbi:MAG: hypothetical protein HYY30_00720 [Chloroflexi bacterium]|nr:hypothetical protein [Chloroflexota bacterium]
MNARLFYVGEDLMSNERELSIIKTTANILSIAQPVLRMAIRSRMKEMELARSQGQPRPGDMCHLAPRGRRVKPARQ